MGPVHAGLVLLLRRAPKLLLDILVERGVLPRADYEIQVRATEVWIFDQGRVSERRVDIALEIRRADGWRGGGLFEVQLVRDENKPERWGKLRLAWEPELGEHLFLVPITLSDSVESWLRQFVLPFVDDLQQCLVGGEISIPSPSPSERSCWRCSPSADPRPERDDCGSRWA